MSIADKLTLIAENEQRVYDAGKIALLKDSKYMNGTASGELVSLKDVSPVEHTVGVEVSSKNLANLSTPRYSTFSQVVEQTENTITIETTATGRKWLGVYYTLSDDLVGKTLTISGTWESTNANSQNAIRIQWVNASNAAIGSMLGYINTSGQAKSFTVTEKPENAEYLALIIYAVADSANAVTGDRVVFSDVQLEVGTTKTAYTPYADTSAAKIQVLGKNLLNIDRVLEVNELRELVRRTDTPLKAGSYTFSTTVENCTDTTHDVCFIYYETTDGKATGQTFARNKRVSVSFKTDSPIRYLAVYAGVNYANSVGDTATYIDTQLELGTVATEYELYKPLVEYAQGESVKSIHPTMSIMTDTVGSSVDVEYLRDIDAYIDNLTGASTVMTLDE